MAVTNAQIEQAKKDYAIAQLDYANASGAYDSAQDSMAAWWNLLRDCAMRAGASNNSGDRHPALGELADAQYCRGNGTGGCISKSTCESNVASYNNSVTTTRSALLNKNSKQGLMDNAKTYLDNLLLQAQQDPNFILAQGEQVLAQQAIIAAEKERAKRLQNVLIFGLIATAGVVIVVFLLRRPAV